MSDYYKKWYETNKESHKAYCRGIITCECGKKISRNSKAYHVKHSKVHKRYLTEREEEKEFKRDEARNEILLNTCLEIAKIVKGLETGNILESSKKWMNEKGLEIGLKPEKILETIKEKE